MRCAIYARVSSQAQRERHTIASQLRVLPEYAAARGWTVVGTYIDDGRSAKAGRLEKREAFGRLLVDAQAGAFEVVLVVDLDRITRSEDQVERGLIYGTLQRAGVRIATPAGEHDLRTFIGDAFVSLQAVFAAEENRKRAERVKRGQREAAAKGRKPAGPTPFGLCYDRDAAEPWSLDDDRAPIVREIFARVAGGEPCHRVAVDLERRGVPRARGGEWQRDRVWQIVRSPTYRGEYTTRGIVVVVPALVTPEVWQAAQDAIAARRIKAAPRGSQPALCESAALCGVCGDKMGLGSSRSPFGKRELVRYYRCRSKVRCYSERAKATKCTARYWRVDEVDARVWGTIERALTRPDLLAEAAGLKRVEGDAAAWRADLQEAERRLARLDRVEAEHLALHRRGKVSAGALTRELEAAGRERAMLERQRDTAREALARAGRATTRAQDVQEAARRLAAGLAKVATPAQRQAFARLLDVRVTLGPDAVTVEGTAPAEQIAPVSASGCSTGRPRDLRFRLVA